VASDRDIAVDKLCEILGDGLSEFVRSPEFVKLVPLKRDEDSEVRLARVYLIAKACEKRARALAVSPISDPTPTLAEIQVDMREIMKICKDEKDVNGAKS
jgi:hypothetical protein